MIRRRYGNHEPLRVPGSAFVHLGIIQVGNVFRVGETNQSVAANAEMTLAQLAHFVGGRLIRSFGVNIHHEIVACGVRFVNNVRNAHTNSLYTR